MNKVPVFLHVPKNAGTYVLTWNMSFFRSWCEKEQNHFRVISVKDQDLICLTVLAHVPSSNINFNYNPEDPWNIIIDLDAFLKELNKKEIVMFSIIVRSRGFHLLETVDLMCSTVGRTPVYYTVLRDSFLRCQSLYHYLVSKKSSHELTHGSISSNDFTDYLRSHLIENNWLTRSLNVVADDVPLTQEHFNNACKILDNFKIVDVENVDALINEVFNECYSITQTNIPNYCVIIDKNETLSPKIKFEELDSEIKNIFLSQTKFDQKIYEKYCT